MPIVKVKVQTAKEGSTIPLSSYGLRAEVQRDHLARVTQEVCSSRYNPLLLRFILAAL